MSKTFGLIAVVGRPNVGKSSLVNAAVGMKVAIVSDKPQTTRTKIMGVLTRGNEQLVFVDTPGFHKPKNKLGQNMMKAVSTGITDVDAAVFVVDAAPKFKFDPNNLPEAEVELALQLTRKNIPTILVINKIDIVANKEDLLEIISAYSSLMNFSAVIPLSAKTKDGIEAFLDEVSKFMVESEHYFDEDDFTDQPERILAGEMIREKLLRFLSDEVPHGTAVEIERFMERTNTQGEDILEIGATVFCERDSHKGIIIGKGGNQLKKIGTAARNDLEEFFGCKVALKIWVKVKEDWRNSVGAIHSLGLDDI